MLRRGFTLIEVMVVVLVLSIILAIAVPQFEAARDKSRTSACWENLRLIESAKQNWMIQEGKNPHDTATWGDLVPKYIHQIPECPTHGAYVIGSGREEASCDQHPR